jgi:hypothetical protein
VDDDFIELRKSGLVNGAQSAASVCSGVVPHDDDAVGDVVESGEREHSVVGLDYNLPRVECPGRDGQHRDLREGVADDNGSAGAETRPRSASERLEEEQRIE